MINEIVNEEFKTIVNDIKNEIKKTQTNIVREVNSSLINMYFNIGKKLEENKKYGNSFISKLSHAIKIEYPSIKGFSERNLKYMKKFYLEYKDNEKVQQLVAQLSWGHNILLMEKIKDKNDNPSIGLILCKNKDKFTAQYALKDINKPIGISTFKLKDYLPSEKELNMYMDLDE